MIHKATLPAVHVIALSGTKQPILDTYQPE